MMSLFLCNSTDGFHKFQRVDEVGKVEALFNVMFFDDLPSLYLASEIGEFFSLKWRYTAFAGDASALRKFRHS